MNGRFLTLLKREWLEARLAFFYFPLGALASLIVLVLLALLVSGFGDLNMVIESEGTGANLVLPGQWSNEDWAQRMTFFRSISTAPFFLIYVVGALFVLLGSLYDERKDRSVLFWKSLPVTDLETVLSKLVVATVVAPLVMIACVVLAQLFLLAVISVFLSTHDVGGVGSLWLNAGLVGGTFQYLLGFLIQALWVLPISGYLLLVSAAAPRLTLLWAIAVPVVPVLLEYVLFRTGYLSSGISRHMEPAALPNFLGDDERIMPVVTTVGEQLSLLISLDLWVGVLIGAAFVWGAAQLRGMKNEL
ncbi:MAG: hypothetical protein AAGE43_16705 [Pseudomonadota bacterium]